MKQVLRNHDWFHPDGFPITVERREPQEEFGPHTHEFAEIVIITGGKGLHITGEDSWELSAGDIFVINGSRTHEYRDIQKLQLLNILYQPDQIKLALLDLPSVPGYHAMFTLEPAWRSRHQCKSRLKMTSKELTLVIELIEQLEKELATRQSGFGFMAMAMLMQIIGTLSRAYGKRPSADRRALLRIGESLSFLESNLEKDICVDSLANIAHMSKRSFLRAFQQATGSSPIAWLIEQRIQRAALLLRRTEYNITEIAFQVGFTDSNYFTRQFTKLTGLSPSRYRSTHRR
jgi:AraC-like DNA-binding protein